MKNNIDSNFAIAILALVAACVGFAFWFNIQSDDQAFESYAPVIQQKVPKKLTKEDQAITDTSVSDQPTQYTLPLKGGKTRIVNLSDFKVARKINSPDGTMEFAVLNPDGDETCHSFHLADVCQFKVTDIGTGEVKYSKVFDYRSDRPKDQFDVSGKWSPRHWSSPIKWGGDDSTIVSKVLYGEYGSDSRLINNFDFVTGESNELISIHRNENVIPVRTDVDFDGNRYFFDTNVEDQLTIYIIDPRDVASIQVSGGSVPEQPEKQVVDYTRLNMVDRVATNGGELTILDEYRQIEFTLGTSKYALKNGKIVAQ